MKKYIRLFIIAGYLLLGIAPVYAQMDIDALYGNIYHAGVTSREVKLSRIYAEHVLSTNLQSLSENPNISPHHMLHALKDMKNPEIYGVIPIPLYMGSPSGGVSADMISPGELLGLEWSLICDEGVVCGTVQVPINSYQGRVRFNFDYLSKKQGYGGGGYIQQKPGWSDLIKQEGWEKYAQIRAIHGGMLGFEQLPTKESVPHMVYAFKRGPLDGVFGGKWQYLENNDIVQWWEGAHMKVYEENPIWRKVDLAAY